MANIKKLPLILLGLLALAVAAGQAQAMARKALNSCEVLLGEGIVGDLMMKLHEVPKDVKIEVTVLATGKMSEMTMPMITELSAITDAHHVEKQSAFSTVEGQLQARLVLRGLPLDLFDALAKLQLMFNGKPILWIDPYQLQTHEKKVADAPPAKIREYSFSKFTQGSEFKRLYPPNIERLSPSRPFALITWLNRKAFVVVQTDYILQTELNSLIGQIESISGSTLSDSIKDELAQLNFHMDKNLLVKSGQLSGQGGAILLEKAVQSQKPIVAIDGSSTVVILPLARIGAREAAKPEVGRVIIPQVSPSDEDAALRAAEQAMFGQGLISPQSAPAKTSILSADAPLRAVQKLQIDSGLLEISFDESLPLERLGIEEADFVDFLQETLQWSKPANPEGTIWELVYHPERNHDSFLIRFHYVRENDGSHEVRVYAADALTPIMESKLWRSFAVYHRVKDLFVDLPKGLMIKGIYRTRIEISGAVQSKLQIKHRLSFEKVVSILKSASGATLVPTKGFKSVGVYQNRAYNIFVDPLEERDARLMTIYPQ